MKLYHRTSAESADAIVISGFKDSTDKYMSNEDQAGVWLSNTPLDPNEGTQDGPLLLVELALSEQELTKYEWIQGNSYREWLIPADLINSNSKVTMIDVDEEKDHMPNKVKP